MIYTGEVYDMYWGGLWYILRWFMICTGVVYDITGEVYDMYWGGLYVLRCFMICNGVVYDMYWCGF